MYVFLHPENIALFRFLVKLYRRPLLCIQYNKYFGHLTQTSSSFKLSKARTMKTSLADTNLLFFLIITCKLCIQII